MSTVRRGGVDNIIMISGGAGNPLVLAGTVDPSAGGGVAAPEGSTFLRYGAGAGQSWVKTGAADTAWSRVVAISDVNDFSTVPEVWNQQNVTASQTDVALTGLISTSFDVITSPRGGSITGLSTRFTDAITDATADSAVVTVAVNGVPGTLSVSSSSGVNPSGGEATQVVGIDTFSGADTISILITTLGSFAPAGATDLEAWLDICFAL